MARMHAILFDIDGTLINTRGAGRAALSAALESVFGRGDEHQVEMSGRTDRSIVRELFLAHGVEDNQDNWEKVKAEYVRFLPECIAARPGFVIPGVTDLLTRLSQRDDLLLGLLTGNTQPGAEIKLTHFGIWDHFQFGAYGEQHLDRDSVAVDALEQVRARADIPPERIIVIGDTPHDIQCARHVGAKAVAVLTGWHPREELEPAEPDELFEDLSNADDVLTRLGIAT